MFCTKCGAEIAEGSVFCTKCGAKIMDNNANVKNELNGSDVLKKRISGKVFESVIRYIILAYAIVGIAFVVLSFLGVLDNFGSTSNGAVVITVFIISIGVTAFIGWLEKKWKEKNPEIDDEKLNGFNIVEAICIVIFAVWICVLLFSPNRYVKMVRNGYPEAYPDTTYGEAFDKYFSNQEWKAFKSEKGDNIVEFNGTYGADKNGTICVQFKVDEENSSFEIVYFDMDGETLNKLELYFVLAAIFEDQDIDDVDTTD